MIRLILCLLVLASCTPHIKKDEVCVDATKANFTFSGDVVTLTVKKCNGEDAVWRVITPPQQPRGMFL